MQHWRGLALWLAVVGASCAKPTQRVSSAPLAGENPVPPANAVPPASPIPPKDPIPAENPITPGNALPGDRGGAAGTGGGPALERYLDRASARAGDPGQAKGPSDGPP